jgi:hypothetical protein
MSEEIKNEEVKPVVGIKESKELIKGIDLLAKIGLNVSADGKITASDALYLTPIFTEFSTFRDAAEGRQLIVSELKDLSKEELTELLADFYDVGNKILAIISNFKKA